MPYLKTTTSDAAARSVAGPVRGLAKTGVTNTEATLEIPSTRNGEDWQGMWVTIEVTGADFYVVFTENSAADVASEMVTGDQTTPANFVPRTILATKQCEDFVVPGIAGRTNKPPKMYLRFRTVTGTGTIRVILS